MQDKHLKTWLFIFVATLMVASGGASFYAQNQTFYKGVEPQQWNFAKASALTVDENATVSNTPKFLPAAPVASAASSVTEPPINEPPETQSKIVAAVEPVLSPCHGEEVPVIKNGQIQRCTGAAPVISFAPKPALKIKIVELQSPKILSASPPSCESQGRFTYTGEDQPGLLYGMCIDCLTTQFVHNGSKCK